LRFIIQHLRCNRQTVLPVNQGRQGKSLPNVMASRTRAKAAPSMQPFWLGHAWPHGRRRRRLLMGLPPEGSSKDTRRGGVGVGEIVNSSESPLGIIVLFESAF
jgi:hypothetical protein